jgi:N-acetylglutamate synthase-like GNAT family acetyltransferase
MTGLHLRQAVENDDSRIRNLIHRVGINPLGLDWRRFLIAETDDGIFIGCGQLKPHADGSLEMASLAVEEKYRGRGVARAIIQRLLVESPRPLYLMCRPELGPLYEKFGFQAVDSSILPPYFRRIRRVIHAVVSLAGREGPLIMRLD